MLSYLCDSYFKNKSRIWKGVWGPENVGDLRIGGGPLDVILRLLMSRGKIPLGMPR